MLQYWCYNDTGGGGMLYRKAYDKLLEWKNQTKRKALCILGARQIGKTTVIRQFGNDHYECFVEINFITDVDAGKIFAGNLDANTIITNLTAYTRKPMIPGKTLVLLDEIQACPNARTAIKFLVEDSRFDYIESGSLLGVKHKEVRSYPVGFEEIYQMYPMDLEEYLWANGVQKSTIKYLRDCYDQGLPVTEAIHEAMCKLFYSYIVVGGMPDVVQTYVDTHDIAQVIARQTEILELYRLDIAQYAEGNDKIKIRAIFDSIPSQLNDKKRRFVLSALDPNGRQLRYADSFNWLADAGVALPCYNVDQPQPPLRLNEKHNLFKLFMGDTGLLCAACMDNVQFGLLNGDLQINMGSILENVIAQQLKANGFSLNYYDGKKTGEIDFVIQNGMGIELLEAKSGNDYRLHSALDKIRKVEGWRFECAKVFCKGNVEKENGIQYYPWYMVMFMTVKQGPKEMKYEVDLSALQ